MEKPKQIFITQVFQVPVLFTPTTAMLNGGKCYMNCLCSEIFSSAKEKWFKVNKRTMIPHKVSVIIWEMFHGRISLSLMLLLLLVNFVSRFRLEMMHISLIEKIRSSLTHLRGFQLLALLPQFIEITSFICTKRINLLILK